MTPQGASLAALLRRERLVVIGALAVLTGLAWSYLWWLSAQTSAPAAMPGMDMTGMNMGTAMAPQFAAWSPAHFLFMFAMWTVMMVGMMTPSVAPMVLIYAQVARQAATLGRTFASTGWFAGGYLLAWSAFACAATAAQMVLERLALLSPAMASRSAIFGGAVLIAAGAYQWTPLKDACLAQCRAPLAFVQRHGGFRPGVGGALRLGALHGLYCIGCCAVLMGLLFIGGVMNTLWIAAIMMFVLIEKIAPAGKILSRIAGLGAIGAGLWMMIAA